MTKIWAINWVTEENWEAVREDGIEAITLAHPAGLYGRTFLPLLERARAAVREEYEEILEGWQKDLAIEWEERESSVSYKLWLGTVTYDYCEDGEEPRRVETQVFMAASEADLGE